MPKIKTTLLYITNFFNKGHERSIKTKKNIFASLIIKGLNISLSLILLPLTINYVDPNQYGIWLTLSSIVGWFSFFDIGFGHGLRNKLAEALAKGEDLLARVYISTTYAILSIIIGFVLSLFLSVNPFINWATILNTKPEMSEELSTLALIVFVFFCLKFIFQLITTVLTANQEPAKASIFDFFGSLISLIVIFILTKTTTGNLIYLGFVLSSIPVIILFTSSLWLYGSSYKRFAPSFKHVKFNYATDLMSLGLVFFIIQIGVIVLFNTNNIIITQLFGPKEVTIFNVAFKLFSVAIMIFNIVAGPLWSAYTDAYVRDDFNWIRATLSKMKIIWFFLSALTILILFTSPLIFKFWIGESIKIPFSLSIAMCFYVIAYMWQNIHIYLLNGLGKIRLQLILATISGLLNIPFAILMGKGFGLIGITLTSTVLFIVMGIFYTIQVKKILNNTAKNIWNK